jgi:hypothetical protein
LWETQGLSVNFLGFPGNQIIFECNKGHGLGSFSMDRKGLGSTMNRWTGAAGSSPEEGHAGVPVHKTSSWRWGEQEERMGILTPGGTRWWRGSDGQALVKGGGSRASSTRRCSGHEGEERGAEMSAVKMAGGVAPFYRARKAVEGSGGDRLARWVLKTSVMR